MAIVPLAFSFSILEWCQFDIKRDGRSVRTSSKDPWWPRPSDSTRGETTCRTVVLCLTRQWTLDIMPLDMQVCGSVSCGFGFR